MTNFKDDILRRLKKFKYKTTEEKQAFLDGANSILLILKEENKRK